MARQSLKSKSILVIGVETAPGRSAALQLCREGARVVIASRDYDRLDEIAENLKRKRVEVVRAELPEDSNDWEELLIKIRDFQGHIHMVVNAHALTWKETDQKQQCQDEANYLNEVCSENLKNHGPLKMVTVWEESDGKPEELEKEIWHSSLLLKPYQRLDSEEIKQLEASGTLHLRAGAVADSIVSTLSFPPGACPKEISVEYVPSSEKMEVKKTTEIENAS